jgi:molecular chaperone HtpG
VVADTNKETLGFQAEVKQLLDLMIHSLYSNKEIFLRELISNASDAIDHLRFAMLSDETLQENADELNIHVAFDKEARTITISDNGIGMNRAEVVENIGTIARSGTREFFQSLTGDQKKDANLIGQFGVGFYSSFVVAERVTLITRRAGLSAEQGVSWESNGQGDYTLETVEKPTRGTDIILHLREGEDELLDDYRLRSIVRKYSDHIMVPILMKKDVKDTEDAEDTEDTKDTVEAITEEQVNKASALWTRSKSDISEDEYKELYRHISHDFGDPLAYVHSRMEGAYEYILLLYIPEQAPFDLWIREKRQGMKLYVRRVFIMDDAEQLMPNYLRFVRGIVDSNDLPLNVSREILQHNRLIDTIRTNSVKKILGLLNDLANNDKEKYTTFWKAFGRALKEGLAEDPTNRAAIAKLLRFASTHNSSDVQDVTFEDYIGRMKEDQDKIYYIAAESYGAAKDSPLLEIFTKKGVEVLLLSDPVDYLIGVDLTEFQGKQLQSVSKGAVDLSQLPDVEGQTNEDEKESIGEAKDLLEHLTKVLVEKVKEVRITTRLTSSPACLVVDEYDIDPNLQRLLKASGQTLPATKPILEINPHHPIILKLQREANEERFSNWAYVLFDQSVLSLGEQLENPISFVNRLNELLKQL